MLVRKLLSDAAPAPVMAANDELARLNDEITRLRRKTKRQRAVIKELQDKVSDVQGENRYLEVELAKKENAAVQSGVERNRAEDQLDEERREHRATREDFHRRSLELMSAARPDPAPTVAANDEITRLRAEIKELRDKHDSVQDEKRGLEAAVERWIHDARQEGVARLRAEDQLDDERSEYRTYREQTHRQMLAIMPAARPLAIMPADLEANQLLAIEAAPAAHALALAPAAGPKKSKKKRKRRRRSPSPSSSDDSSSSSSSSDGASRKKRRRRRKKTKSRRHKSRRRRRRSRSRSMSTASEEEEMERRARRRDGIRLDREERIRQARVMKASARALRRKKEREGDREEDRILSRYEFETCCPICHYAPCRCVQRGHRCTRFPHPPHCDARVGWNPHPTHPVSLRQLSHRC